MRQRIERWSGQMVNVDVGELQRGGRSFNRKGELDAPQRAPLPAGTKAGLRDSWMCLETQVQVAWTPRREYPLTAQ